MPSNKPAPPPRNEGFPFRPRPWKTAAGVTVSVPALLLAPSLPLPTLLFIGFTLVVIALIEHGRDLMEGAAEIIRAWNGR
jgi:hypothetical protein